MRNFSDFVKNKELFRINFCRKEKMPAYYAEYMKISKVTEEDIAYSILFQTGKSWEKSIEEKINDDKEFIKKVISYFKEILPGSKENLFKKAVGFVVKYKEIIEENELKDFAQFLSDNKSKSVSLLTTV